MYKIKQLIDKEISKYEGNLNENDNKDDYTIKKEKWIKNRDHLHSIFSCCHEKTPE